jgi:hypothetical protein
MKRLSTKIVFLVVALSTAAAVISFADTAAANATAAERADFGAGGADGKTGLTVDQMLTYAIQDEYLSRAEYELIIEEYGSIRPFTNIMAAEERHIEWVTDLLAEYGYSLPKDTAHRYVMLPEDLESSFETGIQAEIDNIAMYDSFLGEDLPDDVRDLFEQLKRASENHLRAFRNNLNRYN